ncbi:MAG: SusC/RagA family TonB-linked outer membrane protein [Bacteroidales bacterium]
MKYLKILGVFCAILALLPMVSVAQDSPKIDINAFVVGPGNEPIEGAVVKSRTDNIVVVTDANGAFKLQASQNSPLSVRAVGYKDKVITANGDSVTIALEPSVDDVQLLFRKTNKNDIVGGVSVVNVSEWFKKNYTTNPLDGLNTLAGGYNGNSIWGRGDLLVVIDGIPGGSGLVNTSEIDQITILKGAGAVALYGTHAVNGVIYITTKRGVTAAQQVDVRVNTGMHVHKRYPDYLGAADYMSYYNEARINDGLSTSFTQGAIDSTASGMFPYRYPDIDFYSSDYIKSVYNRSDVNAEIYGGNENARYYTNVGFLRQGSVLNFGEGKNGVDQRFNLRGNVDVNINRWLSANVDAGAIFFSGRGPQTNYWQQAANVRPTMGSQPYHPLIPISMIDLSNEDNRVLVENSANIIDGKYLLGGTQLNPTNPFAEVYSGGFNKYINRTFLFNTGLDMDLSGITEGLALRTKVAIDYSTTYNQGFNHEYRIYDPTWVTIEGVDIVDSLPSFNTLDTKSPDQYIANSWFQQLLYMSAQLDYKRIFDNRHNILAMVIAKGYQYSRSGDYHKVNSTNLGTHFGYNFINKYYLEFNGSFLYTTKLPPDNRLTFSPVLSVGWRISEEGFMDGATAVNNLKLTSTIGRLYTDIDVESNYLYESKFAYRGVGTHNWSAGMGRDVSASTQGANPGLKSPRRDEVSVGIEVALFDNLLEIEGNYFSIIYKEGIVQANDLFPSYMSLPYNGQYERSFLPYVNYDERKRTGYDFNMRLNKELGKINWTLGIAGTYYDTEILRDPVMYDDAYQLKKGTPVDGIWGLKADGFYADQTDIDNSPVPKFGTVNSGDIKYINQNDDDVINSQDEVLLAKGGWYGAPFTLGISLTAKWKNLTFYAQGVGQWGAYGIKNRLTDWVYGQRKYSDVVVNRWANYTHPTTGELVDTRSTATYPRLSTQTFDNNFRNSDFWLYSTNRFDITKVQLSYSLPESIIRNTFIKNVDVYVSGANLLTISPEKKYLETNVGWAPQTRFYNLGISALF